jgi:pyrroline-5-carboxylate reductase
MRIDSVGFVGGGRIARIMIEGWHHAAAMPGDIVVSDPNQGTLDALAAGFPSVRTCLGDNCKPAEQSVVFLGLHPAAFAEALPDVAKALRPDSIVVSLAPKISIERLSAMLGGFDRIARSIPNAPSIVGSGWNPVAFGSNLGERERMTVLELFAPLGQSPVVDETALEAYAVTAAMGPTYLWFQLYELRRLATQFGLSDDAAGAAVDRMTRGALDTIANSGLSPEQVMDLVAVHPLADVEPAFLDAYRTRLPAVMDRIRPA